MWDPNQYPSGMPAFAARLASAGIRLGLYGAASGVTCGGVSGQLGYEDLDMQTIASWGVRYWKSDNCASYAMDSSVRFAGAVYVAPVKLVETSLVPSMQPPAMRSIELAHPLSYP